MSDLEKRLPRGAGDGWLRVINHRVFSYTVSCACDGLWLRRKLNEQ